MSKPYLEIISDQAIIAMVVRRSDMMNREHEANGGTMKYFSIRYHWLRALTELARREAQKGEVMI